jgi:peptide/nickel transport system permease protein
MSVQRYLLRAAVQAVGVGVLMYVLGTVLVLVNPIQRTATVEWSLFADWGVSWETGQLVVSRVRSAVWPSIVLFVSGTVISLLVGVPTGIATALGGKDYSMARTVLTTISAVPAVVMGFVLLRVFAVELAVLPLAGIESLASSIARSTGMGRPVGALLRDVAFHAVLPACTLAIADGTLAEVTRGAAAAVETHRRLGYLEALQLTGMSRIRVVGRYFTRSALVSVLSSLRLRIPMIFGGLIVVEHVFAVPGLGNLFMRAVEYNDVPVLRALILLLSGTTGGAYLLAALVVVLVDPTVRHPGKDTHAHH